MNELFLRGFLVAVVVVLERTRSATDVEDWHENNKGKCTQLQFIYNLHTSN